MNNNTQQSVVNNQKPRVQSVTNRGGIPIENSKTLDNPPLSDASQASTSSSSKMSVSVSKGKEHEPIPAPFPDIVKMSEKEVKNEEHEVEQELESLIEKTPSSEKPKIPEEALEVGMEHAGEDTDIPPFQAGSLVLPMSYDEAEFIHKKNRFHWKNSVAWLASMIMYHWKRININNKKKKL